MKRLVVLGFAICALTGCGTAHLNPDSVSTVTKLSDMQPLPVRCAVSVWDYGDDFRASGLPFRNETGRSFSRIFADMRADAPEIEIVSSKLTSALTNAGFAADWTYDVTVRLTIQRDVRTFSAHSKYRSTGFTGPVASAKIVTEDAISQLADQVMRELKDQTASSKP